MIFDTDVLIWVKRGNRKAARLIDRTPERSVSLQTYLELLQCAENREQMNRARSFLRDLGFQVLPLTENIGHRASVYIEQFTLSHGIRAGDALIAATAVENGLTLCSANAKHYRALPDLDFKRFNPT